MITESLTTNSVIEVKKTHMTKLCKQIPVTFIMIISHVNRLYTLYILRRLSLIIFVKKILVNAQFVEKCYNLLS